MSATKNGHEATGSGVRGGPHVLHGIQACLDGELAREEADAVRAHCAACETCGRAWRETEELCRLLSADAAAPLSRSLWPAVLRRMERRSSPRARISFAVGASAAVAAGLLLGLLLGSGNGAVESAWRAEWRDVGTLLTEDGTTLDDLYLAEAPSGEVTP
jgi:anti-sigma factor RsiW